ncbi:MAG: lipase family protein [Candidatus Pseudobacter hemicellulosilyticus]|uniref:Lipase family protein n=1 Tax=Candidatus Pseudobacter hemicellulosilyticus TaxID=3121375 RepID=A0AAJ5WMT9_9BACT|nr:MAG: lipase family protein [Pseudobacter sp.]
MPHKPGQSRNLWRLLLGCLLCCSNLSQAQAQSLQPGFQLNEYLEMLRITAMQVDTPHRHKLPPPQDFKRQFRSPEYALDNNWELWTNASQQTMVVSIRGTTGKSVSWLENFYAAMIPAKGSLQLNDSTTFRYTLAADPKATVHIGWTLGLATMAPDILSTIRKQYHAHQTRQLIIMGHSQGGALSFLLRSYLYYLQQAGELPADLRIKTYCSAAPKPGNLYYGYDYDHITRNGWSFTVVNALDWVPETPFSLQTLKDFNTLNPFTDVTKSFRNQSWIVRMYLNSVYNKMNRRSRKAQETFSKQLGRNLSRQVKKALPQFQPPAYANNMNYMRAGVPIVLMPDPSYFRQWPDSGTSVFRHHGLVPYYTLAQAIYGE